MPAGDRVSRELSINFWTRTHQLFRHCAPPTTLCLDLRPFVGFHFDFMFSSSALGGSICLRCQIRAVSRRAPPLLAAAQIRGRRRQYASDSTNSRPGDARPAAELREQGREREQRFDGSRQPHPDETSNSSVTEKSLSDTYASIVKDALDLPDGTGETGSHILSDIERTSEQHQDSRANTDLLERTLKSESEYRTRDRKDQGEVLFGESRQQNLSKKTRTLAKRKCPHCRKVFQTAASCEAHLRQGCASIKQRDLKCSKCGDTFATKQLLHRHTAKRLCPAEVGPEELAANQEAQKMEDVLEQAAAKFSRNSNHTTSSRGKPALAEDWSLPRRQEPVEEYHQTAAADHGPSTSAGQDHNADMEAALQPDPATTNKERGPAVTKAAIQEEPAIDQYKGDEQSTEEGSDDFQNRKIVRITRGRKREHRRGRMMLIEDASRLGIETLGKEAEVIVLRDGRQWERRASPLEASSGEIVDAGMKFEDFLDEQGIVSLDDVVQNIHGLKPKRQIVSGREFKSLFNTLLSGFTALQLEKYVFWYREQPILKAIKDEVFSETSGGAQVMPEDILDKHRQYTWMTEQTPWIPAVDGAVEEAQYPLTGYIMKSMPPKQRLVIQLMRECWDLSMRELLDGNGRVDIQVRDLEFKLLTRKYRTVKTILGCAADNACFSRQSALAEAHIAHFLEGGTAHRS